MRVDSSMTRDWKSEILDEEVCVENDEGVDICRVKNGIFNLSIASMFMDEREVLQAIDMASGAGSSQSRVVALKHLIRNLSAHIMKKHCQ